MLYYRYISFLWRFIMSEKIYKTMGRTGAGTLATGICVLVSGLVCGVLLIINGAKLLKNREKLMF